MPGLQTPYKKQKKNKKTKAWINKLVEKLNGERERAGGSEASELLHPAVHQ